MKIQWVEPTLNKLARTPGLIITMPKTHKKAGSRALLGTDLVDLLTESRIRVGISTDTNPPLIVIQNVANRSATWAVRDNRMNPTPFLKLGVPLFHALIFKVVEGSNPLTLVEVKRENRGLSNDSVITTHPDDGL